MLVVIGAPSGIGLETAVARAFVSTKLADLDGSRGRAMTQSWVS